MKEIHEILVAPHVTEETTRNMVNPKSGARKYVFKVALDASKDEIKAAIEKRFDVTHPPARCAVSPAPFSQYGIRSCG